MLSGGEPLDVAQVAATPEAYVAVRVRQVRCPGDGIEAILAVGDERDPLITL